MNLDKYLKIYNDIVCHTFSLGNFLVVHTSQNNNLFINKDTQQIDAMLRGVSMSEENVVTKESVEKYEKEYDKLNYIKEEIDKI